MRTCVSLVSKRSTKLAFAKSSFYFQNLLFFTLTNLAVNLYKLLRSFKTLDFYEFLFFVVNKKFKSVLIIIYTISSFWKRLCFLLLWNIKEGFLVLLTTYLSIILLFEANIIKLTSNWENLYFPHGYVDLKLSFFNRRFCAQLAAKYLKKSKFNLIGPPRRRLLVCIANDTLNTRQSLTQKVWFEIWTAKYFRKLKSVADQ